MIKEFRRHLPHGRQAPAVARRAVDTLADAVDPAALDELRLVVSELVTNSVRHGAALNGDGVELGVEVRGGRARVEVCDGGWGFDVGDGPEPGVGGGWGLLVVDRLAERWGVERADGTRVWVELEVGRREPAAHAPEGAVNV